MNEGAPFDPNYWRKARDESQAKRAAAAAVAAAAFLDNSFLIVTEGTVTEPVYFELLLKDIALTTVRVKVIPGYASDPRYVIRTAASVALKQTEKNRPIDEPARFDHVWAVIDTDVAVREGFWHEVVALADANQVNLAHSTPCFEFWLLLHLTASTGSFFANCAAVKSAVKNALGQDCSTNEQKARAALPLMLKTWPNAVLRAEVWRKHHLSGGTPPPFNPSTEMDILLRLLNNSAPPPMRRL
jgi:hypothetical protein